MNITIENVHIHPAETAMSRALFQALIREDDEQDADDSHRPTRIYIAGPMTGIEQLNFPAFNAEALKLRALGFDVVNPAEINPDHSMPWAQCMRRDIAELVKCDAICLLPGWEQSKGATLEHHIAERLEIAVVMCGESLQGVKA